MGLGVRCISIFNLSIYLISSRTTLVKIYRVDMLAPAITLWTEFAIDEIIEPISIAFDLLAVSWLEIITSKLFTRIASLTGEPGREIVLQLKFDQVIQIHRSPRQTKILIQFLQRYKFKA